jgi:DNA-binding NarL/FixJ family response regulator
VVRIVIADDHELVRSGLKALFQREPNWAICGEAENGQQAVEKAVELKPDLVLLDVTMPVMNGLQAAARIRQMLPETKIMMISMHDSPQMMEEARRVGADAYVTKVTPGTQMLATAAALLNGKGH